MNDPSTEPNALEELRELSSQLGVDYGGGEVKVSKDGKEYLMFLYLPVRGGIQANLVGTPSFFELKTKIPYSHPYFGIRKSNALDWIQEHILFMPDYQVGDKDFDSKFFVKVKNKAWGSRLFSKSNIRQAINDLLQYFDVVCSEEDDLKVIKYMGLGDQCPTGELINTAIEQMGIIISDFPPY